MKADTCATISAAIYSKKQQEKRFLKRFDGKDIDDIVIEIGVWGRGKWEIEIRLPSGCIRRRNHKDNKKK